jgi:threonine/homoserine/homoserine lactone efflux protein
MDITLSAGSIVSLFATMLVIALVPSLSVLTVTARTATLGLRHGVAATLGIVAGDLLFIMVAVLGLSVLADAASDYLIALSYAGGVYLIWLGIRLWRSSPVMSRSGADAKAAAAAMPLTSSLTAGLLLTLGDQKAILFYFVFFPAFADLDRLTSLDTALILIVAAVAVGAAKLAYALAAVRAVKFLSGTAGHAFGIFLNRLAALVLLSVGGFLILRNHVL